MIETGQTGFGAPPVWERIRWQSDRFSGDVRVPVLGRHNVLNVLAAVAVGLELDISPESIGEGLARFKGIGRRFELKGDVDGVLVMDDYGHHPTEIARTLEAARAHFARPMRVVFQPHRYSRTQMLLDEFAGAFDEAESQAREALSLYRKEYAETDHFVATTKLTLAKVLHGKGNSEEAAAMLPRAIDALETQGGRLGGSKASLSGFRAEFASYYWDYLDLLVEVLQAPAQP